MPKIAFEPCTKVPAGPDWIHEIKHDGYRLIVQRDGARGGCSLNPAMAIMGKLRINKSRKCLYFYALEKRRRV